MFKAQLCLQSADYEMDAVSWWVDRNDAVRTKAFAYIASLFARMEQDRDTIKRLAKEAHRAHMQYHVNSKTARFVDVCYGRLWRRLGMMNAKKRGIRQVCENIYGD